MSTKEKLELEVLDLLKQELNWYWNKGEDVKELEAIARPYFFAALRASIERNYSLYKPKDDEIQTRKTLTLNTPLCSLKITQAPEEAFSEDEQLKFIRADSSQL